MEYSLSNNDLRITVASRGAELVSAVNRKNNKEYLWQAKAPFWTGTAPHLFPIVGRIKEGNYTYKGAPYHIKSPHGFVRITELELREHTENSLTFGLHSNKETLKSYPFAFDFSVRYTLEGNKITIDYTVKNPSDKDTMIFAIGAHPGFNVPLADGVVFEDYYIEFDEEAEPEEFICEAAYLTGRTEVSKRLKDKKVLHLQHNLFDNDAIMLRNSCRKLTIRCDKAPEEIRVCFDDFRYVGIWHTNETTAPFVCIEPWNGLPSMMDSDENFETKYDMMRLEPNGTYRASYSIEIR